MAETDHNIDHIRTNPLHNDEQAQSEHERIEDRLNQLGPEQVKQLYANGGLPSQWSSIIASWLGGGRVKRKPAPAAAQAPAKATPATTAPAKA